jgi:hypothetical protein
MLLFCGAIAQAVSLRLPTAAARVRSQVKSCGVCGVQSGTGAGSYSTKCSIFIHRPGVVQEAY